MIDLSVKSKITNYILAGLSSTLLHTIPSGGCVRLFENDRHQNSHITPHSHRFDLSCLVLEGEVLNILWESDKIDGDLFHVTEATYTGEIGKYEKQCAGDRCLSPRKEVYTAGDIYSMKHDEIHSIVFSKHAKVLFFESAPKSDSSIFIEPIVNGKRLKTMKTEPWMFQFEGMIE